MIKLGLVWPVNTPVPREQLGEDPDGGPWLALVGVTAVHEHVLLAAVPVQIHIHEHLRQHTHIDRSTSFLMNTEREGAKQKARDARIKNSQPISLMFA